LILLPPPPVLEGDLVLLRAVDPAKDAADYYQMCLEPAMHQWTQNRVLSSVEEARQELEDLAATDGFVMWSIIERTSGRMIGRFFICMEELDGRRVIGEGNRIAKPFWRKGHNREARRLVFAYAFGELCGDCIESECWTENVNSRLSLLAHGFELVAQEQQFNPKHQRMMDKSLFRLERERWQTQRPST